MTTTSGSSPGATAPGNDEAVYATLARICASIGVSIDRSQVSLADLPVEAGDTVSQLVTAGKHVGVTVKESSLQGPDEAWELVTEGYPVLVISADAYCLVERRVGRQIEISEIDRDTGAVSLDTVSRRGLISKISAIDEPRTFVVREELECSHLSGVVSYHQHDQGHEEHEHLSPLKRFFGLLRLERRDIYTVILFAAVSGVLGLATPLAIESLVNVVSWGTYWQPLVVLAMILLASLGLAGVLKVLQTCLVEIIQRRQMVRIIGDLSHRFPRANQQSIEGEYPRELANRLFDIMTIQKATAILLLDGVSLVLTTSLGMMLLAFYHPFLLGYDIIMLTLMLSMTWILGRGGIRTAIDESKTKYRIVHWLQDVLASPSAFKVNGGERLAIDRTNRLASDYLEARKSQFNVIIRQVAFAVGLQVVASTILLGLGGWLVIQGQLTLGQLVASELVVTVVVGSFAKAGKSIEKFYDLMAGVDKVGHLLDVRVDPRREQDPPERRRGEVSWDDLEVAHPAGRYSVPSVRIEAGSRAAIVGDNAFEKTMLLRVLSGLATPSKGMAEVSGVDARQAGLSTTGRIVGYAGPIEVFNASLRENVSLGRLDVSRNRVRESLQSVALWSDTLRLSDGAGTLLQTGGYPLSPSQSALLMVARAIAARPSVVLIDGLLDDLPADKLEQIWMSIAGSDAPWTLVIATNDERVASRCNDRVTLRTN